MSRPRFPVVSEYLDCGQVSIKLYINHVRWIPMEKNDKGTEEGSTFLKTQYVLFLNSEHLGTKLL